MMPEEAPQAGPLGPAPDEQPGLSPPGAEPPASSAPGAEPPSDEVVKRLLSRLEGICGTEHVITDPQELRTDRSDGLQPQVVPRAAVLPGTSEEVRDVVRACHEAEMPWVARHARTGLSSAAPPIEEGVLVVLSRLRRILAVDLDNQTVTCEPGVSNVGISAAVGPTHFFPPGPWRQVLSSIGGNVEENSGGAHCFKYGFTTNYVLGLDVVLPHGEVVGLGGEQPGLPGYDLGGAFVGSQGTLGVATKITLRVVPRPECTRTLVAFFDTTARAGEVISDVVAGGAVPGAVEMMDGLCIRACEEMTHAGFPLDAAAALLVEIDGSQAECEARFDEVQEICRLHAATEVRVAGDSLERELMWKVRKAAFPAMSRVSPHHYVPDVVIPRAKLSQVLAGIDDLSREYGLEVANVFHAGDGNLHPLIGYDGHAEGDAGRAEELAELVVAACVEAGGSIAGEHGGRGVDEDRSMPEMLSEADLAAFRNLGWAFDPQGRAKPREVMPAPPLCDEVPDPYRQRPLEAAGLAERS